MSTSHHLPLARILRAARRADPAPDAELLARFAAARDEAAFAALVERHGPMVLGVCRRVLGDRHAAEDAFQAAFFALTRNAGRVRKAASLAAWLYGAALRVALKARKSAARSPDPARLTTPESAADPLAEITARELVAVIDAELARLPDTFRAPIVLCCLEGLSQDEAARRLGWSAGSVKGRLERGRERLRQRLLARGITLSAGFGAVLLGGPAPAVPPGLFARAVELAASGVAPPAVAGLAAAAVPAGPLSKLAVVAFLALAAGGMAAVGGGAPPMPARPAEKNPAADAVPAARQPAVDRFGDPLPEGAVLRLGTTRLRQGWIQTVAFNADNQLASFGRDYVVRFWEPATGRQVRERRFEKDIYGRHQWVGSLSPDARRIAMQQLGDRVKVFDVDSGQELASVTLTNVGEPHAQFSPDGSLLAVADNGGKVQVCDIAASTTRELAQSKFGTASDLTFSRDGQRLALADLNAGVIVWDLLTGQKMTQFKPNRLRPLTVDFDASGDVLAVLTYNPGQSVHFVRVSTGQPSEGWTAPPAGDLAWARFAPDGATVVFGGKDGIQWFDPKAGKVIRTATGPAARRPAFSADGRLVASAGTYTLQVWDAGSGRSVTPEALGREATDEAHGVAVSPDGKWIVTRDWDTGTIRLWDSAGRPSGVIRANRSGNRYPVFSRDGRRLFGTAPDAIALVRWDLPGGAESARYTFAAPANEIYVFNAGLSADGRRLAAITQTVHRDRVDESRETRTVTVWDVATAERVESREIERRDTLMMYGEFSPDLRWYCLGEQPLPLQGGPSFRLEWPEGWLPKQAAVSPDGRLVAHAVEQHFREQQRFRSEPRGVIVHETATGRRIFTLPTGQCREIAFTPDGRGLVVTDTTTITRWDLTTQKLAAQHKAPGTLIGSYGTMFTTSLAVSPDGTRAVTGHVDTTALVWELPPPPRRAVNLSDQEMAAGWADLAGGDAEKAYAAIWCLADAGNKVAAFLGDRLRPTEVPPEEQVRKLVVRLDAPAFADREAAEKELRGLGATAFPILRAALRAKPSAEQVMRLERLLAVGESSTLPPGDRLRHLRAVAVLEGIGTEDARKLLADLAGGAAEDRLTREAAAAIDRLSRRSR